MSETKKLRGAMVGYLTKKGHDIVELAKLDTLELLRTVAVEHAKEMDLNLVVSYHREEDLK
jgi:hypothetical protein